eukprot:CAMPEP_0113460696 /NCGR_PEP_ID=MMETSP0014_2-20120614/11130_1 /TAXON_ID=2857 /ORGANISM="Nitzschia sp." /LENGTH=703 /DNA_ID=CAMNT_0000352377 /DNA_START=418 /DNA_END=2529 /DNA_ORIENTATION=+ /assembly_acc=CAM_ASM_000159
MNKKEQAAAAAAAEEEEAKKAPTPTPTPTPTPNAIRLKKRREKRKAAKKAAEAEALEQKKREAALNRARVRRCREKQKQELQQKDQQNEQEQNGHPNMSSPSSASSSPPPPSSPSPPRLPSDLRELAAPGAKAVPAENASIIKSQLDGYYSAQKSKNDAEQSKYEYKKQESERQLEKEKQKTRMLDIQLTETVTNSLNKSMDVGGLEGLKSTSNAIVAASSTKKKKSKSFHLRDDPADFLDRLASNKSGGDEEEYEIPSPNRSLSGAVVGGDNISVLSSLSGNQMRDDAEGETPPFNMTPPTHMATTASDSTKTTEFHSCVASAVPSSEKPKAKSLKAVKKAVDFSPSTKPMPSKTMSKAKATQEEVKAWTVEEDEESADTNNLRAVTGRSPVKKIPAKANHFKVDDVVTVEGVVGCQFKIDKILDDGTKYKLTYKYPKSKNGKPYPHEAEEAELFFVPVVPVSDDDENVDPNMDVKTGTTHEKNVDIVDPSKPTTPSKKAPADIGEPKVGDSLESFFEPSTGLIFSVGDKVICFAGNTKCVASITGMLAEQLAGELTARCDLKIISPKSKARMTSADAGTLSKYEGEDDTDDDDENVDPNVVEVKTTTPAKKTAPVKKKTNPAKKPVKLKTPAKKAGKKTTMTPAKKVSPIKTTVKSTKSTTTKKKTPGKKAASTSTTTSTTSTTSTTTTQSTRPRRTCTMK